MECTHTRSTVSRTTTTGVYPKRVPFLCVCHCVMDSCGQQRMAARDAGSSARRRRRRRRRERRLRAQWRHEQQSIAMALAAARHHSAPKSAGPVSHNVLRNQNTARGADGVLRDVRGLRCGGWWLAAVSCGCVAAGAGSAAHCGANRRPCAFGPVASRRCAADGGTVGGLSCTSRFPCCRAGYRGAQDRVSTTGCSHSPLCAAFIDGPSGPENRSSRVNQSPVTALSNVLSLPFSNCLLHSVPGVATDPLPQQSPSIPTHWSGARVRLQQVWIRQSAFTQCAPQRGWQLGRTARKKGS